MGNLHDHDIDVVYNHSEGISFLCLFYNSQILFAIGKS